MDLNKKRWLVLVSSCLINLCIGSLYAWSVFATPLANELKVTSLAIVFTVANAIGPFIMIPGGAINDKIGPRLLVLIGGILFGAGTILTGFARSTGMVIVTYSIIAAVGISMCYTCTVSNTVKFFPDKRGLVGGLTTATYGLSSVIIPLVARPMIDGMGVFTTFIILGIVYLVIVVACSFLQMKYPAGWAPEGYVAPVSEGGKKTEDKNWKQMLKDPIFYPMILLMVAGAFFGMMIISQASPIAQNMVGMDPAAAAVAVSILALFNAFGRVFAGFVSDKLGRVNTLIAALAVAFIGMILLIFTGVGQNALFYVGVILVGIAFGSFMSVFPGFNVDQFGAKNNSVNYGIMFIGFALAGIVAPLITSGIYESSGSYDTAFIIGCCLAVFGFIMALVYKVMAKKRAAKN